MTPVSLSIFLFFVASPDLAVPDIMPSESVDKASAEHDDMVEAAIGDYSHEHAGLDSNDEHSMKYPNWWSKYR